MRLTALLSGGAVLEAEEAGLAVVVAVALLALLLPVDRQARPESCSWMGGSSISGGRSCQSVFYFAVVKKLAERSCGLCEHEFLLGQGLSALELPA